ncbi:MAG: primosomal replication protein N, partial [Tissierellaceae bacterium]
MSFFLETTDMDLGDTPIENIFINDYMPMANGTYVKVYLLGFKYAYDKDYKIDVNNKTIAKHLNIPLEDVLRAWDFWEEKGIVEKIYVDEEKSINYKVKFLNLKQLYIKNNIKLFTTEKESVKIAQDN